MISGSYPPEVCGVGDYTVRLVEALGEIGIEVKTLRGITWAFDSIPLLGNIIEQSGCDVVHMQYPSVGYGRSILPQLLCLRIRPVVTLHEFSHVRLPRQLASVPFILCARHLVFTSEVEASQVRRVAPWLSGKSSVIPIGSNIRPQEQSEAREFNEVIYFGLISPRKGIEQVLEFASLARQGDAKLRVRILGKIAAQFEDYARNLIAGAQDLPIIWSLDRAEIEVADFLGRASVAYFPFPEGASDRRGSLKAALASGVVCISTEGKSVPDDMRRVLVFASSSRDALSKALELQSDRARWSQLSSAAASYSNSYKWGHIARSHLDLYESILCKGPL